MAEEVTTQAGMAGQAEPAGTEAQPAAGAVPARLAFHETTELHGLLNYKTVCLVKSKLLAGVVFDRDLKALLEKDAAQSTAAIAELESLYRGSDAAVRGSDRLKGGCLDAANAVGMPELADTAVAVDFLIMAKNGVKNYALALTEATGPAVRATLANQLRAAVDLYGEAADLMLAKGWLHPRDLSHQAHADAAAAAGAEMAAKLKLFPGGDTGRRGQFPTRPGSGKKRR